MKDIVYRKFALFSDDYLLKKFSSICPSCSANQEEQFGLFKKSQHLHIFGLRFRFLESIIIECTNCGWSAQLPYSYAKKVFKDGIKSELLIAFAHDKIATSRFLQIYGSMWRVWIWTMSFLIFLTIIKFYSEPVLTSIPREIPFSDINKPEYKDKIVRLRGKVDYTLAFIKETSYNGQEAIAQEVYLPLFSQEGGLDFVVIKGGKQDIEKVQAREQVLNAEILVNQDYEVIGRLDQISGIRNADLKVFFEDELPINRNLNTPKFLINSSEIVSFLDFYNTMIPYYYVLGFLLISSTALEFYLDKRLLEK